MWPCIASLASLCGGVIARQLSVVCFTTVIAILSGMEIFKREAEWRGQHGLFVFCACFLRMFFALAKKKIIR